ncbi:MAG TPA: cupin domain-containing protein [Bryobacteraceae bacterium]|nr:cupin domain-containing protein [Bryobacteraceae bacterium]
MPNLIDEFQQGLVSRRRLLELLTGAAGTVTLASPRLHGQSKPAKAPAGVVEPPKFSPANIGGGGRIERDFYREWLKKSQVPMIEGYSLLDAAKQEVQPWPEIGGKGLYLNFSGNVHMDGVIEEIPAGKALEPKRHFYEQIVYVLAGRGYTTVGGGNKPNKVSWGEGSLFTVPVNALHRHFNSDPAHPARLLFITTFPFMIQVFGSMGLINDSNFSFTDRYDGSPDYFTSTARIRKRWDKTNFVKDVRSAEVVLWEERGDGNASMFFDMGGNTVLEPHVSEFEVGTYKLGHRHPYEAIILTLNGRGYSLAEKDKLKDSEAVKIDWQAGSVVSPPFFWFHQHFNTGKTKARYLAITEGDFPLRLGIPLSVEQIEADKEDPNIKKRFDREAHPA